MTSQALALTAGASSHERPPLRGIPNRLTLALAAAFLLNIIPTLVGAAIPNYDRETHLFMADHYLRDWFSPWETRWFGGFFVLSYAPLTHQLIAGLAHLLGLESAYALVQLAVMVALPASTWLLTREMLGEEAAGWAALLAAVASAPFQLVYGCGMLPTVLAYVLMLSAAAYLLRYLRTGSRWALLAWAGLGSASVSAHHFTGIVCMLPLSLVLVAFDFARTRQPRLSLLRAVLAGALMALASLLVILGFWWWLFTQSQPQREIPHFTRELLLAEPWYLFPYVLDLWGGGLLILPFALAAGWRDRRLRVFTVMVVVLALLGLGGRTTQLPRWLFPGWWRWLTYERFAFWGSLLAVLPGSLWLARQSTRRATVLLALCAVLAARSAAYSVRLQTQPAPLARGVLRDMVSFLDSPDRRDYYYLTLGLGESNLALLSRSTTLPTLDGLYHTARRSGYLRECGVGPMDCVTYAPSPAPHFVEDMLLRYPEAFGLMCVFSGSEAGSRLLAERGWVKVGQFNAERYRDVLRDGPGLAQVEVWQASRIERVHKVSELTEVVPAPPLLALLWGLLPGFFMGLGILAALAESGFPDASNRPGPPLGESGEPRPADSSDPPPAASPDGPADAPGQP